MLVRNQTAFFQMIRERVPGSMIGRYRVLMLTVALVSSATLGAAIVAEPGTTLQNGVIQIGLLAYISWRWFRWYATSRIHPADLIFEVITIVTISTLMFDPGIALAFIYVGVYYRPLFMRNRHAILTGLVYLLAYVTGLSLATNNPSAPLSIEVLANVPILLVMGVIARLVAVAMEQNDEMTNELAEKEEEYRTLVEQLPGVVVTFDQEGQTNYVSPRIHDILGYSPSEYLDITTDYFRIIHPEDKRIVFETVERCLKSNEPMTFECRVTHARGDERWIRFDATLVNSASRQKGSWRGIITDVTEQHRLADQLEHRAFHDDLTDLPNRSLFESRLRYIIDLQDHKKALHAIVFLDLDNFKVVNDSLGHIAGDQLLISAAERIMTCLRPGDTVARLGGDEFAILLTDLGSQDEAFQVAERLKRQLATPFHFNQFPAYVSASIGIAFNESGRIVPETLIRRADVAMYEAKKAGKSRYVVFEDAMEERAWQRLEREGELRHALEQNELRVCYQPVVDLSTGAIQEIEALVRWQHPTRGLLAPDQFLPLAGEIGLMPALDLWVMEQACRSARQWQQRYPVHANLIISVNVSPGLLREPKLAESVGSILDATGLAPDRLKLEVTENAMLNDIEHAMEAIKALNALGVHIAIDDFGTGSSALSYLRYLPIGTLKIDRSYIADLEDNPKGLQMMTAIVNLAKSLGLTVTAEGIEHRYQTQLQALGCDLGQGFYFAKPVPSAEMERLLQADGVFENYLDLEHQQVFTTIRPSMSPVGVRT